MQVDGRGAKPAYRLQAGQRITLSVPETPRECPEPEPIPVGNPLSGRLDGGLNKPPGMVVHPARGHWSGTLASAVQYHLGQLSTRAGPTRPGIVHRLDRDTSGLILVARNDQAHFAPRCPVREAHDRKTVFCPGQRPADLDRDLIDRPIGVHPQQREKMAIRHDDRPARPKVFTRSWSGSTASPPWKSTPKPAARTRSACT